MVFLVKIAMKPYSLDLRQKIIDVYENEPISQRHKRKALWSGPELYSEAVETTS
jgi:hypothetical protein